MQELVGRFPANLPAAVFIVLHVASELPSMLPQILGRSGPLPVKHAEDGDRVQPGRILIAPPDRHLTIEDGVVRVSRGPRENRHRPAIDPLFRTAARVFDSRVIGVILSGHLDDGAAGLHAIRLRGGLCIVQDPNEATAPQMPKAALQHGGADYVLPKGKIGIQITSLVNNCGREAMVKKGSNAKASSKKQKAKPVVASGAEANLTVSRPGEGEGTPSTFACPECSGVLWELKEGELVRFRCRVGHSYTMNALAQDQMRAAEEALWAAMRALEEKAALATRISETTTDSRTGERYREQAQADRKYADTIRKMLFIDDKESRAA
jgi:two-component system chemotaxis response regulator CheB